MKTRCCYVFLALICFLGHLSGGRCEDAEKDLERGRLPDGRAFRTDAQGNQLIDYIAELELSVEQLNRRVQGLEDEVKEKQAIIARERIDASSSGDLIERDIIKRDSPPAAAKEVAPRFADSSIAQPARAGVEGAGLKCPECGAVNCDAEIARTAEKLESCQSEAGLIRGSLESERQNGEQRTAALNAEILRLRSELESVKLQSAKRQALPPDAERPAAVAMVQPTPASAPSPAAGLPSAAAPAAGQGLQVSAARLRAVDAVRGKTQTDLNQLRSMLGTRDQLFAKYSQRKHAVAFRPSPALSSRNRSPAEIASAIQAASSISELSTLSREIAEIEGAINDDIALMRRMDKIN